MSVPKFTSALGIQFIVQEDPKKPHVVLLIVEDRESSREAYDYLKKNYPLGTLRLDMMETGDGTIIVRLSEMATGDAVANMELTYNQQQLEDFVTKAHKETPFVLIPSLYTSPNAPLEPILADGGKSVVTISGYNYIS
jgi:ssRNA-specific RNase YbeY (16S rRNA maturation enzyme)